MGLQSTHSETVQESDEKLNEDSVVYFLHKPPT